MTTPTAAPSWFARILAWARSPFVKQPWVPTYIYPPPPYAKAGCAVVKTVPQATTDVLALFGAAMTNLPTDIQGVKVPLLWRDMQPTLDAFDYATLDAIAAFWAAKGKGVIPCVGPWFYQYPAADGTLIPGGTPDWVLTGAATYTYAARSLADDAKVPTVFPDFRDPLFVAMACDLARRLGIHYDGMPGIAFWQIGTGNGGEDNGPWGDFDYPAWYTEEQWVAYNEAVIPAYLAAFKTTPLRFDAGRLFWIASLPSTKANAAAQATLTARIQALLDTMRSAGVVLSCDGWSSLTMTHIADAKADAGITPRGLLAYQVAGGRIALEAIGPMTRADMQDGRGLLRAVPFMRPALVTLFHDWAGSPVRTLRLGGREAVPKG